MDIFYQHYKYKVGLSEKAGDPIYWMISYLDEYIVKSNFKAALFYSTFLFISKIGL